LRARRGISTGNIYRYFVTKKHLLGEILTEPEMEIEEFFKKIPREYDELKAHEVFELLADMTASIAEKQSDTLKVMFNSEKEEQFIEFKNKVIDMFVSKTKEVIRGIKGKKFDETICEAVARAEFEGFTFIVKKNIDDIKLLKKNLLIYEKLMMENMEMRVWEVMKND